MAKEFETQEEQIEKQQGTEQQEQEDNIPTVEELMTQLAQERAERAKLKNSFDRTSSELADTKKADEEHKKYVEGLETKIKTIDATKRYMGLGMDEKLAEETAAAEIAGDVDKVTDNMKKYQDALIKAKEAEWLKSRPPVNAGHEEDKDEKDPFLEGFNS